jgi:NADH-quinone oxidoreductase subunit F
MSTPTGESTDRVVSPYPWAPGYYPGDRPAVVTSRFQYEDSHTLERYLATGGYEGLRAALAKSPTEMADEVKNSTLLGRGGAGFPAGVKWGFTPKGVWPRYLVVNGDESEPGTYKDRLLMECDPHQLIEGCLIASYAAGLSQCFLYIRGEMPLAHERVAKALNDAYAAGYIGTNILGTDFSLDIVLHYGAGAYVVGEETALIESLEGERGMPRLKPPYFPAAVGLYGQPTIVNNVETLSNLPFIASNGSAAYTEIGTPSSPGTRMIAVSGHVNRPGVYEIVNGIHHVPRPDLRRRVRTGHPRRQRPEGVRAGRRLCAVVPARSARHRIRGPPSRRRRLDARLRRGDGDGFHHRHSGRGAHIGAVLRARVVRQVRALS